MTDCEHTLPLSQKFFAYRGRGRVCTTCGSFVYVPTPIFDGIFSLGILPLAALLIAAWLHRGIYLASSIFFVALLVFFYVTELRHRAPVAYNNAEHHRNTKRNLIAAVLILVPLIVALLFWLL